MYHPRTLGILSLIRVSVFLFQSIMTAITPDQAYDKRGGLLWRAVFENRRGYLAWRNNAFIRQDIRRRMHEFNFPELVQQYITQEPTEMDYLLPTQQLSGNRNVRL